jgi:excisionase family DNA binding protein
MLGMSADSPRQTVSILEACTLVGVSRRTIYNWLAQNKLEYVRTAGGAVRIMPESLFRPGSQVEK